MLDFTQKKKKKFTVKLHDGFIALIPMPSKGLYDKMVSLGDVIASEEIFSLLTEIINLNAKKKYSFDSINKMFDFEDALQFITEYVNFVTGVTSDPN